MSASEVWSPCTAILSPLSDTVAVLTLFCTEKAAEVQRCLLQGAVTESSSKDYAFHLPEVVSSVLSQVDISIRDDLASSGKCVECKMNLVLIVPRSEFLEIENWCS